MRISVFGIGQISKSPYVTAKQLTNIYCEKRPRGEKSSIVGYRTPGTTLFKDAVSFVGVLAPRGALANETNNLSYVVIGNKLFEVNATSSVTSLTQRGVLNTGVGRVSMADNGVEVMIVDGLNGYIYDTVTLALNVITSAFPANPITCAYLSRRFIVNVAASSRFYWSAIDDGTTWDALDFANAEASPDPIVAVWASNGQLLLLGSNTSEYFGDSGTVDAAFSQIKGTATEWGLAATWSVAKYDNSIAMLMQNRMGQVMVAQLAGYLPKKISTPDMDSIINAYGTVSDASAYSYMLGGHPMYVINFPSANARNGASWLYDGSTGIWTQLIGYGLTRNRAEFGWSYLNMNLVADYALPRIYVLTDTVTTDIDPAQSNLSTIPIESIIVSENLADPDLDRFEVSKFRVDVEVGQGTSAVEFPQIGLSVSRDNGNTWGAEMMRDLGPIGNYANTVDWTRLGTARNFVFKLRVTDPVAFTLVNAMVNPDD